MRLDDDVDLKIEQCMSNEWKTKLQEEIDEMISSNELISNWFEMPRWLKGQIKTSPLKELVRDFHGTAHYANTDINISIAERNGLIDAINDNLDDESLPEGKYIILRTVYEPEE